MKKLISSRESCSRLAFSDYVLWSQECVSRWPLAPQLGGHGIPCRLRPILLQFFAFTLTQARSHPDWQFARASIAIGLSFRHSSKIVASTLTTERLAHEPATLLGTAVANCHILHWGSLSGSAPQIPSQSAPKIAWQSHEIKRQRPSVLQPRSEQDVHASKYQGPASPGDACLSDTNSKHLIGLSVVRVSYQLLVAHPLSCDFVDRL